MNNSEILMLKSAGFTQAQISSHKQKFNNLMRLAPSLLIDECESLRAHVAELEREKNEAITGMAQLTNELAGVDALLRESRANDRESTRQLSEARAKSAELEAKALEEAACELEASGLPGRGLAAIKLRQLAAEKRAKEIA